LFKSCKKLNNVEEFVWKFYSFLADRTNGRAYAKGFDCRRRRRL